MNPLSQIPPKVRQYVYLAFTVAGIALGALAVAGVDTGKAGDVLAYLGAALGITAASNVKKPKHRA